MQDNNDPTTIKPGEPGCSCVCHRLPGVSHIAPCCHPTTNDLTTLACCDRPVSKGHAPTCDLRYGTTHAMPTGEADGRRVPCCGRLVNDLHRGDMSATDGVNCPGKNEPLSEQQAWEDDGTALYDGHRWAWIGEDGEQAYMAGHVEFALLHAAIVAEAGYEPDEDEFSHSWVVVTTHMPDCRDGLEPDESCRCDDFGWWGTTATETTPGALPVTMWSA